MLRSWKLGTAFGIGIYVHWTFLLVPLLVFWNSAGLGASVALFILALTLAVFGCVVLHELGHALMARRFGIPTRDITLYPIGGVASMERMSERPWEEFWIAVAGPAVNVAIAALLGVLLFVLPEGEELTIAAETLLLQNIVLVLFNLLPAFPMDGGRVLRALLALRLGRLRATEIAVSLSAGMAWLFMLVGVFWAPMLMVLAVFIFFMGQQELLALRHQVGTRRQEPLDVLPADEEGIDAVYRPHAGNFTGFTWDQQRHWWIEWRNGRAVNVIPVE
jgi:Zn-dependent protease